MQPHACEAPKIAIVTSEALAGSFRAMGWKAAAVAPWGWARVPEDEMLGMRAGCSHASDADRLDPELPVAEWLLEACDGARVLVAMRGGMDPRDMAGMGLLARALYVQSGAVGIARARMPE